jgi:hypothetical protein
MFLLRGLVTALSVRWAWPAEAHPPSVGKLLPRGVASTVLAALLLSPSTVLLFGLAVVPVSWLFIAAVPVAFFVALIVNPVAVRGGWWRRSVPLGGVGWVAASFLALTVGAALVAGAQRWSTIPAAIVLGGFNARAWVGLVRAVVVRRESARFVPAVPLALAVLIAGVVLGSVTGFEHAHGTSPARHVSESSSGNPAWRPVLVVSGYGSSWDGRPSHPIPGRFFEQRFSYRGVSAGGTPLEYGAGDTVRSVGSLVRMLSLQVEQLARQTGRRVDLVAESEGALLAETFVLSHPRAPVSTVVLVSPLLDPGRAKYAVDGSGRGSVPRAALQTLGEAYGAVSPVDLSPTNAFLESLDKASPLLVDEAECPLKGVRRFAILPLADATASPPRVAPPFPSVVVPAFHGGLIGQATTEAIVEEVLEGRVPQENPALRVAEELVASASTAWQVPNLDLSDYEPHVKPKPPGSYACTRITQVFGQS